jgi:colicin import membrane protein
MKLTALGFRIFASALFAGIAFFADASSASAAVDASAGEQSALASERAAAEAKFAARDQACRQRFVVSACVADARRDRRIALDALRIRQRALDDAERQERASERRADLAAKSLEDGRREAARAGEADPASSAASALPKGRPFESPHADKTGKAAAAASAASSGRAAKHAGSERKAPPAAADPALRKSREERSREAFTIRQKQAAQHREEVIDAAIRRMKKHPPGSSLPLPGAPGARAASTP